MVVCPDLLNGRRFAVTWNILVLPYPLLAAPSVVGSGDSGNIVIREFTLGAVHQVAELAGIDEQHFSSPVTETVIAFVARQEPQAGGNLGRIEKLPRQGDHAIHHVALDHRATYLPFPA